MRMGAPKLRQPTHHGLLISIVFIMYYGYVSCLSAANLQTSLCTSITSICIPLTLSRRYACVKLASFSAAVHTEQV